ncbi:MULTISPECIES: sensor histidine kinase [unclassified Streptomyces]|uniref:sensor histidine kinase n=1 Tax=Streptomyces sp. NPDC127532 TaxID=3345399 RepID=UPI00363F07B5
MISRTGVGRDGARWASRARYPAAGPALMDAALWTALMGSGVLWYLDRSQSPLLTGLLIPALVLAVAIPDSRRGHPGRAVLLANGLCALGLAAPGTPANPYLLALGVLSFLLGTRSAGARAASGVFAGCVAVDLGVCAALGSAAVHWFYAVTLLPVAMVLPWLTGRYWHARQALVHGGWQRARNLEKEQRYVVEQARLRERTRIAADMHDSLGHVLSLIALRAGALELSPTLAGQDRDDVAELRVMVTDAVDQLRDVIGILREDVVPDERGMPSAPEPPRTLPAESVEQLVERVRESGVSVALRRDGGTPVLPPLVDRAAYRVVQESLTNAIKHAPGSEVLVRIVRESGRTRVRVTNSRPRQGPTAPAALPGHGLTGLRERVLMLGGTLRTQPAAGGFDVVAVLPDDPRAGRPRTTGSRPGTAAPAAAVDPAIPTVGDPAPSAVGELASSARRRARLRFALAFVAPAGVGLVALLSAGLLGYQMSTAVLHPTDYAALRIGAARADHRAVFPARPFRYPSDRMRAVPAPPRSTCDFYRSGSDLLEQVDVYRLCWSDSRLVSKDVLPGSE